MIEKFKKPFAEPTQLFVAGQEDFLNFGIAAGKFLGTFKSGKGWKKLLVTAGSLRTSCLDNGNGTYDINIQFRISYAGKLNSAILTRLSRQKQIARYTSPSGTVMIAGTKAHPLKFEFSKPESYDGYDCTLKGIQTAPECFL